MIGEPPGWIEVPKHVARDRTLTPIERSVLLNVAARLPDDEAAAVVELDAIADEVGCGSLMASRAVGVLAARGLLHITQRPGCPMTFSLGVAWPPARVRSA